MAGPAAGERREQLGAAQPDAEFPSATSTPERDRD
jgi:hypothetical protein